MQPQIVRRLRDITGELGPSRLGFSEGQVATAPEEKPVPSAADRGLAPLDAEVAAAAATITDAELREVFTAAAARYLSRVRP
jgi:hypothetical protein